MKVPVSFYQGQRDVKSQALCVFLSSSFIRGCSGAATKPCLAGRDCLFAFLTEKFGRIIFPPNSSLLLS